MNSLHYTLTAAMLMSLCASGSAINVADIGQINALYYAENMSLAEDKTIENICQWTEENVEYKFGTYPRGIDYTLNHLLGDCTDKSEVVLQAAKTLGIQLWRVHGYVEGQKHDWLMDQQDQIIDTAKFPDYDLKGSGYW